MATAGGTARRPAAALDRRDPRAGTVGISRVLLAASLAGSVVLGFPGQETVAPVDALLLIVVLLGTYRLLQKPLLARRILVSALPFLWIILVASFLSLFGVGIPQWALTELARDAFAFLIFFSALALAEDEKRPVSLRTVAFVAYLVCALAILFLQSERRPGGTFGNPNYAGHFLVAAALYLYGTPGRLSTRLIPLALAPFALLRAGSFGGIAMLSVALLYIFWTRVWASRNVLVRGLWGAVAIGLAGFIFVQVSRFQADQEYQVARALSGRRFEASSSGRFEKWTFGLSSLADHPMGVGPAGVKSRALQDQPMHNDYLGFLVERGPLGLAGLLGFSLVLWRYSRPDGVARVLLVSFATAALFHDTVHFRHLWLLLAVSYAYDLTSPALWLQRGSPSPTAIGP